MLITAALAIEHNRTRPLLNTRWLSTGKIAKLFLSVLLFRIVLSESTGAVGFLQELADVHVDGARLAGGVRVDQGAGRDQQQREHQRTVDGALIDAHATSQTRPVNMYVSQFLLAFGGTYFLGPTMVAGMGAVIAEPRNLVSFSVMFTMTQNIGGLLGSAIVGTIQTARAPGIHAHGGSGGARERRRAGRAANRRRGRVPAWR